jgi:hypothetical protein
MFGSHTIGSHAGTRGHTQRTRSASLQHSETTQSREHGVLVEKVSIKFSKIQENFKLVNTKYRKMNICSFIHQCNTFTSYFLFIILLEVNKQHGGHKDNTNILANGH